ncbi:MAG TPA: type II toxin-antitoxin system VapC family toxin [Pseudolabrys sp.]|nr:type II toxin-antitoxin system VapC family toxin [Pseudolabrys sp.]
MSVVIDSSVTLAWIYSDERSPPVERVFADVIQTEACVPAIWRLEVANGLQQGIRRRRIDKTYRDQAFADLLNLKIITDKDTDTFAWSRTVEFADNFALTSYDASYLELAHRLRLPLATLDRDLRNAGAALGLELLGV